MKINYKSLAIVLLLTFAIGSLAGGVRRQDRPFLRAISSAAKIGLKLLVFMEPPPPPVNYERHTAADNYIDHHRSL